MYSLLQEVSNSEKKSITKKELCEKFKLRCEDNHPNLTQKFNRALEELTDTYKNKINIETDNFSISESP